MTAPACEESHLMCWPHTGQAYLNSLMATVKHFTSGCLRQWRFFERTAKTRCPGGRKQGERSEAAVAAAARWGAPTGELPGLFGPKARASRRVQLESCPAKRRARRLPVGDTAGYQRYRDFARSGHSLLSPGTRAGGIFQEVHQAVSILLFQSPATRALAILRG